MEKRSFKRLISFLLGIAMVVGMIPANALTAFAASNIAGTFEGQDADIFSALGFDTSEVPEGYDAETTDNPYGRDKLPGNQVFELLISGSKGVSLFGNNNNNISVSGISGAPSETTNHGMVMTAVAAGDFDGDGLAGEVVYVGYKSIAYDTWSSKADLYMCVYDASAKVYSQTKKIGTFNPAQVTTSGGTNYSRYDWAWQNLLQVTAGDYDGDGMAEIAAYVADDGNCRVDVFKFQKTSESTDTSWRDITQWKRTWSHVISNTANQIPNMVSLASGDFNRDGVDDLAVSYGRFAPGSKDFTKTEMDKSHAVVLWGGRSDMLQSYETLNLNEGTLGDLVRVSLIAGDLDNDGYAELIATGQPYSDAQNYDFSRVEDTTMVGLSTKGNTERTITTYIYDEAMGLVVNYSGLHKTIDGSFETVGEGEGASTNWQSNNGFDEKYFSQPAMRTNAAVFKGEGQDYPTLYLDSCLYEWAEGQVTLKKSLDDAATGLGGAGKWGMDLNVTLAVFDANYVEYGAVSADMNGDGFSTLATGVYRGTSLEYYDETEEGPVAYAGHKSGYMVLGGSADGTLNSNITLVANCDSAEASQDQLSVSLAMVDTDIDTVLIEYTGEHYLTYSDPKVYAIIAAAPYFEDVDKVANYDYAWQNTTSYSIISGGGRSDIVGVDLEAGIWLSADVVAGGGKVVTETAVMYTLEWEKETAKSTEYVLSFETSQNEDSVAFFSIPTENYLYKISTPDGKGGYVESYETVSRAFTPCYQILTLDYYESIQGNYEELPQIAGTVLKSTPGDPSSYPSSTSGYKVITEWNKDPAGVSFGNGAITQEITVTKEHTESYNMGVALDYKLGYGGEFQSDLTQSNVEMAGGGQFSLNPTGGWATFNLEGASYSGTVTNMPLEFQEYGYYYTWKLFAYAFEFGGGEIPVVSYVVNDVSEPPKLPEDFQQDYDRTTSDKNVLTWTYDDEFSSFLLYKYYDFPVGGGLQQILEVPKSCAAKTEVTNSSGTYIYGYTLKYDDDGKLYKEYYIEDCNLAPYTEYDYAIQVERLSKVPPRSSTSGLVTVRTKAADGNPLIPISESDGEDDGKLLVYPDKTSYLTVEATGPKGEAAEDYYTTVQYQWQKQEKGAWTDIVGETSETLTFAKAGVDSAGEYRCLVNVLTKADNTAISTYTKSVTLTHAKRISYIEESTFGAQDVSGGGVYIYAKVRNAHADSAAIPSGTITFNLTNNATGINYQFSDELNAEGVAEVTTDYTLPEGMYTVDAYYSGSYNFISCTAQTLYLSQRGSGYDVDAPASVIYGEGAEVIGRAVNKSAGITDSAEQKAASFKIMPATAMSQKILSGAAEIKEGDSVSAGSKYVYNDEGLKYYFVAAHTAGSISFVNGYAVYNIENEYLKYTNDGGKYVLAENTPADTYMISMTFGEGVNTQSANAVIVVLRRDITLKLPKQKGDEGAAAADSILVSELEVVDGSWAECDMADGTLVGNLAVTTAALKYYNTAGTNIASGGVGALCGYYTVKSTTAINNYNATYVDGSYTVLGGTNQLSVGARYFEGKDVGTVYVVSPDYEYTRTAINAEEGEKLTQKHATGTRLVVTAVPDDGYTIYAWYINGVKQKSVSNSVSYTMLNEETTIEVQFDVKKNTLSFGTAGDEGGGTIVCSDETLTSGSVVLPNAYMTFEAVANEGYHFKEWRYTELGSGTVYDDDDSGKASSSFELLMPSAGCSVYAVFERDYYKLTYADSGINSGLTAWYTQYQPGATEGETVYVNSGDSIKGGTVVTVGLKQGYLWNDEYNYVVSGSQGVADYEKGTYVFSITEDTSVYGSTIRNEYDVTLVFDVEEKSAQPVDAKITYTVDGKESVFVYNKETASVTLENIPGGSSIRAEISYPGYYLLDGWTASSTKVTATTEQNKLAVEAAAGDELTKGSAYWYTAENATGGKETYYFVSPVDGTLEYSAENVTVYASGTSYVISEISADDTITVHITEKDLHKVTVENIENYGEYSFNLPEGAFREGDDIYVHDKDDFDVLITPKTGWTVTYWNIKPTTSPEQEVKATSLRYVIPEVTEDFHLTPIFAATTYNIISWPTISEELNYLTLSEYNCVASVVSGNSFSFILSGDGLTLLDKVYANGKEFIAEEKGGNYTYKDTAEGRIYTIYDVRDHHTVTVDFKEVGITVNGTDISALKGSGWSYDAPNQMLVIERSNLSIGGTNDTSVAPNLTIKVEAESATLYDINLTSGTKNGAAIFFEATETILTVTGSNSVKMTGNSSTVVKSSSNTTAVRGTGSLTVSGNSNVTYGITVYGDLDVSGRVTVNVKSDGIYHGGIYVIGDLTVTNSAAVNVDAKETAIGIVASNVVVGTENGSDKPIVRVKNAYYGMDIGRDLYVYNGELAVEAETYALDIAKNIMVYNGVMELTANNILKKGRVTVGDTSSLRVYYPSGYNLRFMEDTHTVSSKERAYSEYNNNGYDVLASVPLISGGNWVTEGDWLGIDGYFNEYYSIRLSPLTQAQNNNEGLKLAVTVGDKTYTGPVVMREYDENNFAIGYYYLDEANSKIKFITKSEFTQSDKFSEDPGYTIVAYVSVITLYLEPCTYTYTPADPGVEFSFSRITVNEGSDGVKYDYSISGSYSGTYDIHVDDSDANSLTLDNADLKSVTVDAIPVYLIGDNYLSEGLNPMDPEEDSGKEYHVELISESGNDTLTVNSLQSAILGVGTTDPESGAYKGEDVKILLNNVKSFEASGFTGLVGNDMDIIISYKDADGNIIPYGRGWKMNAGENSATSTVQESDTVDGTLKYLSFYRNTEEAELDPTELTFDKTRGADDVSGLENAEIKVFEPIYDGQIRRFDKAEDPAKQDDAEGYVTIIYGDGSSEEWTNGSEYTWIRSEDLSVANTLSISSETLSALEIGAYTIRVFFYDESTSDNTYYYSDIALNITDVDRISGDLRAEPIEKTVGRGETVKITTSYTGTRVMGYEWVISGNTSADTVVENNGASAVVTIGADEAVSGATTPVVVTVTSYADTAKTIKLGSAIIHIIVVPKAENIDITCENETPSGDGSYTLHHTATNGFSKSWNFLAAVTMDDGSEADPSKVSWSLWGNRLKATYIDSTSGVLTVSPEETGIDGAMKVTAKYENADGTVYLKTIDVYLSSDVWVAVDNTDAVNGTIAKFVVDGKETEGTYVPVGTELVITAQPNEKYNVRTWYVNGESVMNAAGYTVDEEARTLTFTTEYGKKYVITADYINENAVIIDYSAEGPGAISAAVDGTAVASGDEVLEESTITFTAVADKYCVVEAWYVDGVLQEGHTKNTLTLENLAASHEVKVVFKAPERIINIDATEGGSVTAAIGEETLEGDSITVTSVDTVLLTAKADDGYRFIGWSEGVTATGGDACLVMPGTEEMTVTATFEKIPEYTVTITTNSYENGTGTVKAGDSTVEMASTGTVTVLEGENLTVTASVDVGCYLYSWAVEGAEYTQNGDSITLQNVDENVTIGAKFRREKFDVTCTVNGDGEMKGSYLLTVMDEDFNGTLAAENEVRGGSRIELVLKPYAASKLNSLTINGVEVSTEYDADTNTYTYAVDALVVDMDIVADFITLPTYAVTIPTEFKELVEITEDPEAPTDPEEPTDPETPTEPEEPKYEEKLMGTMDITFVADGISEEGAVDETGATKTAQIAKGGTAVITAASAEGYETNMEKLREQIGNILEEAGSETKAEYALTENGVKVTLSNVDMPLDFSGMEAPFVEKTEKVLYKVTLPEELTGGSIKVMMGDVEIENGAAVEENTELTVTVSADSHYELAGITANGVAVEDGKYVVTEDVTFAAELNIKHSYESVVTEPTCTAGGYTTHTCTECGNSYTSDETKELGHSFTNYVSDNNATVDSDGTKTAKCDRCDATDTVIDEGSRLSVPDRITSDVYTVADGVIRKIPLGTTVAELIDGINEKEYIRVFDGDMEVSGDTKVGTGMVVKLMFGSTVKDSVTAVVTGDLNGDGKSTITDMLNIKSVLLKKLTLDEFAEMAADLTGEGKITITDFVQSKAYILKKGSITAR